ncbi:hypothetical protein NPX13_g1293 [Xylaria arbuscula]|uniref:Uncharacterized protein n=1 Tax=Xylaria arbuscula TaxID=114810 RepID=A0A9W8TRG2_9PEZI|nr:hypothetical protein NPX13_g1293 [Xylaria arbuscula]
MADPISLALGIAPLALSAVKGLKAVRSRLKTLRGHDRILRRLRRSFTTQSHVFLDECHLLLQQVADPADVVFMLEDSQSKLQSELWRDPDIDKKLREYLGRKYDDVRETIGEILNQVKSLDERLNRMLHAVERDVRLTTAEKVREAFDVMSNKTDYESDIDHLKELNQEFKRLRKVAKEINRTQTLAKPSNQKRIPKEYRVRGEYARSFYNALRYCWSCTDVQHAEHNMALALDWENGRDMHIVLHCTHKGDSSFNGNSLALSIRPQDIPPMRITQAIRSLDSSSKSDLQPFKRTRFGYNEWSRRPPSPSDHAFQTTIPESIDGSSENLGRAMELGRQPTVLVEVDFVESPREPIDLRKSRNVCGALLVLADASNSDPTSKMECFLDTPDSIRHALSVCDKGLSTTSGSESRRIVTPLLKILERALDADLGVTQQLRLVLQLVKGHLQLHWTPWWRQYWSLSDLSYFADSSNLGTTDLGDCLGTLHIGTRLDFDTLHFDASAFHLEPHVETALLTHGIRNLSLYCLGIALLQIGRWDPLVNATDDVVAVRRLAARNSRLGPRYQNLTQKCIDCDFGEGSDLGNPQLQGTIYESVVCELESLIGVLEKI